MVSSSSASASGSVIRKVLSEKVILEVSVTPTLRLSVDVEVVKQSVKMHLLKVSSSRA